MSSTTANYLPSRDAYHSLHHVRKQDKWYGVWMSDTCPWTRYAGYETWTSRLEEEMVSSITTGVGWQL